MLRIDFADGTIFLPRKKDKEFYIKTPRGMTKIPHGWVHTRSRTPPSLTLTRDIKFRVTSNREPAIHTSRNEFTFEPNDIIAITNVITGEKVWPVPEPPSTRGFKWL